MAHSIYEQEYPWIEVIFVSNGSPAETIEAIRAAENYLMKRRYSFARSNWPMAVARRRSRVTLAFEPVAVT